MLTAYLWHTHYTTVCRCADFLHESSGEFCPPSYLCRYRWNVLHSVIGRPNPICQLYVIRVNLLLYLCRMFLYNKLKVSGPFPVPLLPCNSTPVYLQAPFLLYIQTCERILRCMHPICRERGAFSEDPRLVPSSQYPSYNRQVRPERLHLTVRGFPLYHILEIGCQKRTCFFTYDNYLSLVSSSGRRGWTCHCKKTLQASRWFILLTYGENGGQKRNHFFRWRKYFKGGVVQWDERQGLSDERDDDEAKDILTGMILMMKTP